MAPPHFLVLTYSAQGHINPALEFCKRLIQIGAEVTFVTPVSAQRLTVRWPNISGLRFAPFSDGFDGKWDCPDHVSELRRRGSEAIHQLIVTSAEEGRPVACLVYTSFLQWAAAVAQRLHVRSALLWIQSATVFDIFYFYFNGYGDIIRKSSTDPSCCIQLPGLQLLTSNDLPSFMLSSNPYASVLPSFQEQLDALSQEINSIMLVNTFDALEPEGLQALDKLNLVGIGPLVPSAFLDEKKPSDTFYGGDLSQGSIDYMEWLHTKPKSSVIYVSFGTMTIQSNKQMEEIAQGLLRSGRPFLWVIKEQADREEKHEEKLRCREELEQIGMIVPWCSQMEVLLHPSLGCFMTHCGWNSTLESLVCGAPVVAIPQWTDQATNAKLITDIWRTGVRVWVNEEGIVEADQIMKCLEIVMGDRKRGEELRRNAEKWKSYAKEAVKGGGSSYKNMKAFVDEFGN